MLSSKTVLERNLFAPYGAGFGVAERALSYWRDMFRTSADAALWWTEKWIEAPSALLAMAPVRYGLLRSAANAAPSLAPVPADKPAAEVIDLAEAAAARTAEDVVEMAETAVEIAETASETPVFIAEDAVSVATAAAETLAPDDLTRLVGIGPKLAAALAERGVTRYAQIAAWTADEISELDKALDLKGRPARDAWVAQAKRFSSGEAA